MAARRDESQKRNRNSAVVAVDVVYNLKIHSFMDPSRCQGGHDPTNMELFGHFLLTKLGKIEYLFKMVGPLTLCTLCLVFIIYQSSIILEFKKVSTISLYTLVYDNDRSIEFKCRANYWSIAQLFLSYSYWITRVLAWRFIGRGTKRPEGWVVVRPFKCRT